MLHTSRVGTPLRISIFGGPKKPGSCKFSDLDGSRSADGSAGVDHANGGTGGGGAGGTIRISRDSLAGAGVLRALNPNAKVMLSLAGHRSHFGGLRFAAPKLSFKSLSETQKNRLLMGSRKKT